MKRRASIIKVGQDSDVTPDAVDWADIENQGSYWEASYQQITGISSPITLDLSFTGPSTMYYAIDTVQPSYATQEADPIVNFGFVQYNSGDDIVLNNGEYLSFICEATGIGQSGTITVTNISDNNTVLDTLDYTATLSGPPI